jgi:hypothetical protein
MAKNKSPAAGDVRAVFEIEEGACTLTSKNERLEKHGDEEVLACDLGFEFKTDNGVLACFAAALKSSIYQKGNGAQAELVEDAAHMTSLRFPQLGPLKWEGSDLEGATVTLHMATGKKGDVVLSGVKANKFRLECQEGGTVIVRFRVQVSPLDDAVSGRLSKAYANRICTLSLTAPQPSAEVLSEAAGHSPLH